MTEVTDFTLRATFPFINLASYLDELVPMKAQKGLSNLDVVFTSIDVTLNYIAIGTNIGVTYLYDRSTGERRKLKCDGNCNPVTFVRCLETVDLMVAIGTSDGLIVVFQISLLRGKNDVPNSTPKIKRYLINNLHSHQISCLEWSRNGMKLVSGDENGVVGQSEMDYTKDISKSQFILKEPHAIVQLGYQHNVILVSSLKRTLLYNLTDNTSVQVGSKDRKSLGRYGACFCSSNDNPRDVTVFASRPSLRLWKATTDGKVVETFIFKEELSDCCQTLTLDHTRMDPSSPMSKADSQFGELHLFSPGAVSWSARKLFVVDMREPRLTARCDQFTDIARVAACGDEMFVLERPRLITRIACSPDREAIVKVSTRDDFILNPLGPLPNAFKDFESIIKKRSMMTAASLLDIIRPNVVTQMPEQVDGNVEVNRFLTSQLSLGSGDAFLPDNLQENQTFDGVSCAKNDNVDSVNDVATKCSPTGSFQTPSSTDDGHTSQSFADSQSSESTERDRWRAASFNDDDDDDDSDEGILFERLTGRRKLRNRAIEQDGSSVETSESNSQCSQPDESVICQPDVVQAVPTWNTREEREKLLAGLLDLSALFPTKAEEEEDNNLPPYEISVPVDDFVYRYDGDRDPEPLEPDPTEENKDSINSCNSSKTSITFNNYEDIIGSYLGYGPPSGSSNNPSLPEGMIVRFPSLADQENANLAVAIESAVDSLATTAAPPVPDVVQDTRVQPFESVWVQHKAPCVIQSISVCENYIVCTDVKQAVYYSTFDGMGLDWRKTDFLAKQISVSPSGKRLWRIYHNSAYVLVEPAVKGPFGRKWLEVTVDAVNVAVSENCVWYATQTGDVYAQDLKKVSTHGRPINMSHPVYSIAQVVCTQGAVWALTVEGKLLNRSSVSLEDPFGKAWSDSSFRASERPLVAFCFGSLSSGWVIDDNLGVWFQSEKSECDSLKSSTKTWWQVKMCDFVYQSTSAMRSLTSSFMGGLNTENFTYMLAKSGRPCVASAGLKGIWIYLPNNQILFNNHGNIKGHHWRNHKTKKFCPDPRLMIASGVYQILGALWLYQPGKVLFCLSSCATAMQAVDLPEQFGKATNLHCLGAAPETLWLLTDTGRVFIRKDISVACVTGKTWVELDLSQISNHKLVHLSCGPNVVWALNHKGAALMRIGSLTAPTIKNFSPAWVAVIDEQVQFSSVPVFTKVYVGPLDYNVWAIDTKNNVYVREGIFPELLIGLGWVLVSGIKATSLAISEVAVYALSPNSKIFRRYNISRSNYIGDYWMELPCPVIRIFSVTVDDNVWAIDSDSRLIRLESCTLPVAENVKNSSNSELRQQSFDDEWEVI